MEARLAALEKGGNAGRQGGYGGGAINTSAITFLDSSITFSGNHAGGWHLEAEPEGGPIADMYADEMDAYEGALRIAKGSSDTPLTYDQAIGRVSRDDFE